MHTSQLPSIATQQANRIKQLEAQAARQSVALAKADAVIAAVRKYIEAPSFDSRFPKLYDDLELALNAYDAWLKELDK